MYAAFKHHKIRSFTHLVATPIYIFAPYEAVIPRISNYNRLRLYTLGFVISQRSTCEQGGAELWDVWLKASLGVKSNPYILYSYMSSFGKAMAKRKTCEVSDNLFVINQ